MTKGILGIQHDPTMELKLHWKTVLILSPDIIRYRMSLKKHILEACSRETRTTVRTTLEII